MTLAKVSLMIAIIMLRALIEEKKVAKESADPCLADNKKSLISTMTFLSLASVCRRTDGRIPLLSVAMAEKRSLVGEAPRAWRLTSSTGHQIS